MPGHARSATRMNIMLLIGLVIFVGATVVVIGNAVQLTDWQGLRALLSP